MTRDQITRGDLLRIEAKHPRDWTDRDKEITRFQYGDEHLRIVLEGVAAERAATEGDGPTIRKDGADRGRIAKIAHYVEGCWQYRVAENQKAIAQSLPRTTRSTEALAEVLVQLVVAAIEPVKAENAVLHARLDALESRALKEAGIWRTGTAYAPGDVATFKGTSWVCRTAHTAGPTVNHDYWRMLHKGRT